MQRVDIAIGAFFVAFGLVALWQSLQLDLYQGDGVPGAGMFPMLLAITLVVLGTLLVITRVRGSATQFGEFSAVRRDDLRRPVLAAIAFLIAIALLPVVGFALAMLFLSGVLLFGVERLRSLPAVVAAVAIPVVFYVLFGILLDARLPGGFFE